MQNCIPHNIFISFAFEFIFNAFISNNCFLNLFEISLRWFLALAKYPKFLQKHHLLKVWFYVHHASTIVNLYKAAELLIFWKG